MKKTAFCLLMMMFGFMGKNVYAYDWAAHYRTLHIQMQYTKSTKDFQIKTLFPFHLPDNLPAPPVFKGMKGTISSYTHVYRKAGQEQTFSETLFSLSFSDKACPVYAELSNSWQDYFVKYRPYPLTTNIIKQTQGDREETLTLDFMHPYGIPLDFGKSGCILAYFDGTDFQNMPYTVKLDLQLKYSFVPLVKGLDAEFLIGFSNDNALPRLNAYSVLPVTDSVHYKDGIIRPGTIVDVNGNISASGLAPHTKGNWYVRYVTAVYKNGSCQKAFKNHAPTKFFWNDHTGTRSIPNHSSVFWPTTEIISDFIVNGKDNKTVMHEVSGNRKLPIHVEEGDCVVQAAMPFGDRTTGDKGAANTEFQVYVNSIPD